VDDVPGTVAAEMRKLLKAGNVKAGQKVGITGGSRGIQNLLPIVKSAIATIREFGAEAVLLAAMGSHGGGTAAGQAEMLTSLGMTRENLDIEILTCDVGKEVGVTAKGLRAYMLEHAFTVDHIIPINRVKIHTSFHGTLESGCIKKLVVGLGGPPGALQFHSIGKLSELSPLLEDVGQLILDKMPVPGGIAIVENGYEETALIRAMPRETMIQDEIGILEYSRSLMPALPCQDLHALMVEEMGKNYSGTGIDANIVGRLLVQGEPEPVKPAIRYLAVFDLSDASHGNAIGMGFADFTTRRFVDKIDRKATYLNCLTGTFPKRGRIPVYMDTEKAVLDAMLQCLAGTTTPEKARMIFIPNTLFLSEMYVTEAVYEELQGRQGIERVEEAKPITFTATGDILPRIGNRH
jgi:hypothetical protein